MKTFTLADCIEFAKRSTANAKAVKAWRLRKADRNLQAIDMPKGYIIATGDEIRQTLLDAGKKTFMTADSKKRVWTLYASISDRNGKVELDLVPVK